MGKIKNWYKSSVLHSFRDTNLSPEITAYLKYLSKRNELTAFISQAINRNYYMEKNPKGFTFEWIKEHFNLTKHLLRIVGSIKK